MRSSWWWTTRALLVVLVLTAASCTARAESSAGLDPSADRQTPGNDVVRRCGSHYAADFDAGLESRIVTAGSASMVGFRVSPVPSGVAPVKTFKVMVRLRAASHTSLETLTDGTSLLYDRARFNSSNDYQLRDGDRRVRFIGCPDQAAVFNGAVLTSGPRAVDLLVIENGARTLVRVAAYDG